MDFHLFKQGIKPVWEDAANRKGGKWILRLKKGLSSRIWENLLLAVIGKSFLNTINFLKRKIKMKILSKEPSKTFFIKEYLFFS